ncbi:MAG: VCBS repeat-containing protein [Puniceicoccales bacterium]|nr:VCBS repeat-containing protein [Puniceicoccales bacterium]
MKKLSCFLLITALAPVASATDIPSLGAPLIAKLNWNTSSLQVADLDGDGLNDLALLNNDTGRIGLLYQRKPGEPVSKKRPSRTDRWTPELENALFHNESITGDAGMRALAVGDLNADGLPDLVFTSARSGLNIVLQGPKKGEWREPIKDKRYDISPQNDSLRITDVDGNGKPAIIQLAREGIVIWRFNDKNAKKTLLPEPRLFRTNEKNSSLVVTNLLTENSAKTDAPGIYIGTLSDGDESRLRFRKHLFHQKGVSAEFVLDIPASTACIGKRLHTGNTKTAPQFAVIDSRRRIVSTIQFIEDNTPIETAQSTTPQIYATPSSVDTAEKVAFFDTDGDGLDDFVVTDAAAATLLVYRGLPNGEFSEPVEYPSLANISSLAPISIPPPKGKETNLPKKTPQHTLLMLGEKDGILSSVNFENGKPSFPSPISLTGSPILLASQGDFAVILVKNDDPKNASPPLALQRISRDNTGKWQLKTLATLSSRREITALRILDINNDKRPDILTFVEREATRIWLQNPDNEKFTEAAANSAFRKGILSRLTPADIGWGVVDASASPTLLASSQGFLRALRFTEKDELRVVLQANGRRATDRLRTPLVLRPGVLVALNETANTLEWFTRDNEGIFRPKGYADVIPISPLAAWTQQVKGETTPRLLFLTKEGFVQIPTARRGLRAVLKKMHETNIAGFIPAGAIVGSLSTVQKPQNPKKPFAQIPPPARDILLFDFHNHILNHLHADRQGNWHEIMHFTLFDSNPHYRGQRDAGFQPRDGLIADLTGDGLNDLVLLMHDRVFVYPRQK